MQNPGSTCVLVGSESLLIQCGDIWTQKGHSIAAVVSGNPQILAWAAQNGHPSLAPGKRLAERLESVPHDYFFSITNLSILSEDVLALPRVAAINFHDGPLPRYAGMYSPAWALIEGESEYGVSFHEMTAGVDEGDLYVQRFFPIGSDETSLTLNTRCYEAAIDAFGELADGVAVGALTKSVQDPAARSYFSRHKRPAAAAVLDWRKPAEELARWVRAMDFGHYENAFGVARVMHQGSVALAKTTIVKEPEEAGVLVPGHILAVDESGMTIACGEGSSLRITEWTCPKGYPLTAAEAAARLGVAAGGDLAAISPELASRLEQLGGEATRAEAFWVRRLTQLDPIEVPYRNADRATGAESRVGTVQLDWPADSAVDAGIWIAGFAAYLGRVSGRSRFDLGFSEDALRERLEGCEDLFSTQLPLPIDLTGETSPDGIRAKVAESVERVRARQTHFSDVVVRYPQLAASSDLRAGRLSSVSVDLRAAVKEGLLGAGVELALVVSSDGRQACLRHDLAVIPAEAAEQIAQQLQLFLAGFVEPDATLRKIPLLEPGERATVLLEWNATAVDYPRDRCVHALFDERVAASPEEIALVFEGESVTFRELAARANRLAHHLQSLGLARDHLAGIYLDRSIEMVVSALAVLKAGGAYVPLDPNYPADRITYMIEDSKASIVVTTEGLQSMLPAKFLSGSETHCVVLERDAAAIAAQPDSIPDATSSAEDLSYVIYTSGSTGKPKGVMVEHRNVVNFFAGMDERIPHEPPGSWLAVTSLSFDISVLELLWTLTRGFKVVVYADRQRGDVGDTVAAPWRPIDFGLALWGNDSGPGPRKYQLMLEAAKFGDAHGFSSVMTPERHFGAFGGPFPNPSVTSAAIAAVTERIQIRAGSCVLPLHNPIRIAEEWAVVDNLSGGRIGISFASGWQPNDFVIRPEAYATAKTAMFENAEIVQRLWRGEAVEFENPKGDRVPTKTLPRPVQEELPSWITTAGNIETFRAAGAAGFNLFTHLLGQSLEELAEKIRVYRRARSDAGLDPRTGIVTCMLHAFVGEDIDEVREIVRGPMKEYLSSAMALVVGFAWSFPAFERPGGPDSKPEDVDLGSLSDEETDTILEFAFERYFETSGLFGTPEVCARMVDRVKSADIDEIACLIDFGVPNDIMLASLPALDRVRAQANLPPTGYAVEDGEGGRDVDHSLSAQISAHAVTHIQCTPSHASMLLADPDTRGTLSSIDHWMIGGEAFPVSLAADLDAAGCRNVTNMYGPTETTIWSSSQPVSGCPTAISIGKPIANTQFYILGESEEPLPVGVPGEPLIGGEGVVRGYLDRPDLTAERFIPDPFSESPGARLYRTGDLARWKPDGTIDLLGRMDHQVKIRGYRIELGEIEARLSEIDGVREAVVVAREDMPGDIRLAAYLIAETGSIADDILRGALGENLPDFMVPSVFVFLDRYPQTPNGKIDRKALPALSEIRPRSSAEFKAPGSDLETSIAGIWKEVLYVEEVGIDDNFFDLGGHSLLVVQAHRKLREKAETPVSLTDLYRFPTIRGLAAHLSSHGGSDKQVEKSQARGEKRRQALARRRRRGGRD